MQDTIYKGVGAALLHVRPMHGSWGNATMGKISRTPIQAGYFHKNMQIRTKPLHAELGASRDKNKKGLQNALFGRPV